MKSSVLHNYRVEFRSSGAPLFDGKKSVDFHDVYATSEAAAIEQVAYREWPIDGITTTYFIRGYFRDCLKAYPTEAAE